MSSADRVQAFVAQIAPLMQDCEGRVLVVNDKPLILADLLALLAEREALWADRERLDWLQSAKYGEFGILFTSGPDGFINGRVVCLRHKGESFKGESLRQAIDAARAALAELEKAPTSAGIVDR